jgi:hypothetical protein
MMLAKGIEGAAISIFKEISRNFPDGLMRATENFTPENQTLGF